MNQTSQPQPSTRSGRGAGRTAHHLTPALVGTGTLMAGYLLLRPYGDAAGAADPQAMASAFASNLWVAAHVMGALAVASFARLATRLADLTQTLVARFARGAGVLGAALVLPYYGAETFGLHAVGQRVLAGDSAAIALAGEIRDQPVAMTMFTLGLLLLAASGIAVAVAWARALQPTASAVVRRAAWPLGIAMALFTPQFFLPVPARMAYGVLYLAAAIWWLVAANRTQPERGAYMMTATPTTQISAPAMS